VTGERADDPEPPAKVPGLRKILPSTSRARVYIERAEFERINRAQKPPAK
jgi:hypothetical protein